MKEEEEHQAAAEDMGLAVAETDQPMVVAVAGVVSSLVEIG